MSTLGPSRGDAQSGDYDPQLPFLRELECELSNRARQMARTRRDQQTAGLPVASTRATRHRAAPRRRQSRGERAPSRIARRALTLVALLCLIGASAFGADRVLSGGSASAPPEHQGPFLRVASGSADGTNWSLRLYVRNGELCRVLTVGNATSSRCSLLPRADELSVTSVVAERQRYFYGVAGSRVRGVALAAGDFRARVPTHAILGQAARAAGLPVGPRWFVAVMPRPLDSADPVAQVRGLDAAGAQLGSPLENCTEAQESNACPG